jgi:hypothetical protein
MTEVIMALTVAAGVLVVGWFLVAGRQVLSQSRVRGPEESPVRVDADDSEWLYGDRAASDRRTRRASRASSERSREVPPGRVTERESLLEERLASAELEALEIRKQAEREAESIVKDAELEASKAIDRVERSRDRLEQEKRNVKREQDRVAAKQKMLSEFVLTALEEIERASANGSAETAALKELRDKLRSTE